MKQTKNNASENQSTNANNCVFCKDLAGTVRDATIEMVNRFNTNRLNRDTYAAHANDIKHSIATKDALSYISPVEVNVVTGNVVDGQHRIKAFKEAIAENLIPKDSLLKVYYLSIPKHKEIDVIKDKQNKRSWGMDDYVKMEIKDGNKNYILLQEFGENHELANNKGNVKFGYSATFLNGRASYTQLRNGNLTVTAEQVKRAHILHNEIVRILDAFGLKHNGRHINAVTESWMRHRDSIDINDLVNLMTRKRDTKYAEMLLQMERQNTRQWDVIFETAAFYIDTLKSKTAEVSAKRVSTRAENKLEKKNK